MWWRRKPLSTDSAETSTTKAKKSLVSDVLVGGAVASVVTIAMTPKQKQNTEPTRKKSGILRTFFRFWVGLLRWVSAKLSLGKG